MSNKLLNGIVVRFSKDKRTVYVAVTNVGVDGFYDKVIRKVNILPCDNNNLEIKLNDRVIIQESRPISKTKHFRILKVNNDLL